MQYLKNVISSFLPVVVLTKKDRCFGIYPAFFLLLLASCARQGAPAGGPKDTKPPEVIILSSTPNFSTHFDKKRIELKFDEWVVLTDPLTQIIVSPPLAKRPEVLLKGKSVVVNFDKDEVLHPNTTYTINFGTSVKDFHEGNTAKDLRFVFSTGDFIDSLSFRGILTDAFSGDPMDNISIMLYENFADSAVTKERPYYFSRTDKNGQYEFQNLRSGTYWVVAIEDADQNLKWDGETERIAFRDSALVLNDSLREPINLKIFKNQSKFRLIGVNSNRYGLVKLGFNRPIKAFETKAEAPDGLRTLAERSQDSLLFWYDLPTTDTTWRLLFSCPELRAQAGKEGGDTISVVKGSRSDFIKTHSIGFWEADAPAAATSGRGKPLGAAVKLSGTKTLVQGFSKPAVLPFNYPITAFDTSRWLLTVDTNRVNKYRVNPDSASPRRLLLDIAWTQSRSYSLALLPGAITDFWGVINADTLRRIFNVLPEKQLGTLSMTLEKLKPGTSYILQILNGTAAVEERAFTAASTDQKLVLEYLPVATYTARLIEDSNGNGRWDTGNFKEKRQPEPIFNKKIEALRANWVLEVTFSTDTDQEKKRNK